MLLSWFSRLFRSKEQAPHVVTQSAPVQSGSTPSPAARAAGGGRGAGGKKDMRNISPSSFSPMRQSRRIRHSLCPATPTSPLRPSRRLRFSTIEKRTKKRRRSTLWRRLEENDEIVSNMDFGVLDRERKRFCYDDNSCNFVATPASKISKFEDWKSRIQNEN